jgi:predicted RNA-binding Zn ribbon-like protein
VSIDPASSPSERTRVSADVGGVLALEFANTAGWHLGDEPSERLTGWRDFARWSFEQGLIDLDQLRSLSEREHNLGEVLRLREAVFRIGVAVVRGKTPDQDDTAMLMKAASASLPEASWSDGRLRWNPRLHAAAEDLLCLIARDALELFGSARMSKLRMCEGGDCGWLFIDESRGRPRRWCSMADCGNRAKARAIHRRRKSIGSARATT